MQARNETCNYNLQKKKQSNQGTAYRLIFAIIRLVIIQLL